MVRVWNIYIIIHRRHQFSEATVGKQRTPGFAMKMGLIKLPTHDPYSTSHEEDHSMHVCVCVCVWLLNLGTAVRSCACWMTTSPARPVSDDAKMAVKYRSREMGSICFATESGSSEATPTQLGNHDAN